jgi:hypothetical protein
MAPTTELLDRESSKDMLMERIMSLEAENSRHIRNMTSIKINWKVMLERTNEIDSKYNEEVDKLTELKKVCSDQTAKNERLEVFLTLTERARNTLEKANETLYSDIGILKHKLSTSSGGIGSDESHETSIDLGSFHSSASNSVASLPANLVLNAKLIAANRMNEDLKCENDKMKTTMKQLRSTVNRQQNRICEETKFREILDRRISVMEDAHREKLIEIEAMKSYVEDCTASGVSKDIVNLELQTCLCSRDESLGHLARVVDQLGLSLEDEIGRKAITESSLLQCTEHADSLRIELSGVKRENPVLLQGLRFEIHSERSKRNHWEAKVSRLLYLPCTCI